MTLWMRPRRNDEADKAKWHDLSGNGHHGTLQNFAYGPGSGWEMLTQPVGSAEALETVPGVDVEDFESLDGFSVIAGGMTIERNTTEVLHGTASVKGTTAVGTVGRFAKTGLNLNVPEGGVRVAFYTHDKANLSSIEVRFCNDTMNYFRYAIGVAYMARDGWNIIDMMPYQPAIYGAPSWSLPITKLEFQVAPLAGASASVSFDILQAGRANLPAATIQFDDAWSSVFDLAFPYMAQRGIAGTVYVISDRIGTEGYMTAAQLQHLNMCGWDLANHTKTHPDLTSLTQEEAETEFTGCKSALDALGLTRASAHLAYPGGLYNETVIAAAKAAGMLTGRTTQAQYHDMVPLPDPYAIRRRVALYNTTTLATAKEGVDRAVSERSLILIFGHKLVEGTPTDFLEWGMSDFRALIDYIVAKGVRTPTISQVYAGNVTALAPYHDLMFGGTDDYVAVPDTSVAEDKDFTYEAWFAVPAVPATQAVLIAEAKGDSNGSYCMLYVNTNGKLVAYYHDGSTTASRTGTSFVCGRIVHGAVSADGTNAQLYVDGVAEGAPFALPAGTPVLNTAALGRRSSSTPVYYLPGALLAARMYSRGLTASEVAQNYAAGPTGWDYVEDGLAVDFNAAYCVPILPGVVSRARERGTPYTVSFALHTAADPTTPVSGLTPAVIVARDGGVFATAAEAVTEPGSAGVYAVTLTDSEMDADEVGLVASAAGVTDHVEVLQTIPDLQAIAAAALVDHPVPTKAELDAAVAPLAKDATVAKQATIEALNDVSVAEVEIAAAAALVAYDPPTEAELNAAVAPLAKETTLEAVADVADAIKLRTDRIGTASAVVVAPVTTAGTLMLRQGDDYRATHGRSLPLPVDDPAHLLGLDAEGVVVRLKCTQATWTATGVTSTADGYLITFQPTAADTRALTIPRQPYELEAKLADGDVVTLTVGTLVSEPDIPAVT